MFEPFAGAIVPLHPTVSISQSEEQVRAVAVVLGSRKPKLPQLNPPKSVPSQASPSSSTPLPQSEGSS